MQRIRLSRYVGLLAVSFVLSLPVAAQNFPDLDSLINEVSTNTQVGALAGYSYKMEFMMRRSAFIGTFKLKRRYEVILPNVMPKKRVYPHPLLLVYDSNRNLSATDIILEKKRIIKKLEEIENGLVEQEDYDEEKINRGGYITLRADKNTVGKQSLKIDLVAMMRNSVFSNPKEITVDGRDTLSLDFRPKPDAKHETGLFYLSLIEGILLIDKKDKRIVEVEGFPLGKLKAMKKLAKDEREPLSAFHYLQTRVPEGFWFPKIVRLNLLDVEPVDFENVRADIKYEFSSYKRFQTDVRSVQVDQVEVPETEVEEDPKDSKPPF